MFNSFIPLYDYTFRAKMTKIRSSSTKSHDRSADQRNNNKKFTMVLTENYITSKKVVLLCHFGRVLLLIRFKFCLQLLPPKFTLKWNCSCGICLQVWRHEQDSVIHLSSRRNTWSFLWKLAQRRSKSCLRDCNSLIIATRWIKEFTKLHCDGQLLPWYVEFRCLQQAKLSWRLLWWKWFVRCSLIPALEVIPHRACCGEVDQVRWFWRVSWFPE